MRSEFKTAQAFPENFRTQVFFYDSTTIVGQALVTGGMSFPVASPGSAVLDRPEKDIVSKITSDQPSKRNPSYEDLEITDADADGEPSFQYLKGFRLHLVTAASVLPFLHSVAGDSGLY